MWLTRWNAISGRIRGLRSTSSLFFASLTSIGKDLSQVGNTHLVPAAKETIEELQSFHHAFREVLPPNARRALDEFLKTANKLCDGNTPPTLARATLALASIQDALDFHLAGSEAKGRSITERAFEHLQRSIVADDEVRAKWKRAFDARETECEKLGAVHLLLHGIWGFKVNAQGEQTDLVFGEPLQLGDAERSAPSAIVLTEWKRARRPQDVAPLFAEARQQAGLYAGGSLSDLELTTVRFLVVVSEKIVPVPPDEIEGSVRYRHRLIAVDPDIPSVTSKKLRPPVATTA